MPFKDPKLNKMLRKELKKFKESVLLKNERRMFCKKIKLGEPIKSSNVFEENYVLCYEIKKKYAQKKKNEKLGVLKSISNNVYLYGNKQPHKKRREKKYRTDKNCWVCHRRGYFCHHIVQLNHGGYDNPINRIPICVDCHEQIHPHLKQEEGACTTS